MSSHSPYDTLADRPLFGDPTSRDCLSFAIITAMTSIFVLATFIGMFLFHHTNAPHIFLNVCLTLLLLSHLCLAFWYRSGNLEPRFRNMLFYNTFVIILFCICSNLIISGRYGC